MRPFDALVSRNAVTLTVDPSAKEGFGDVLIEKKSSHKAALVLLILKSRLWIWSLWTYENQKANSRLPGKIQP